MHRDAQKGAHQWLNCWVAGGCCARNSRPESSLHSWVAMKHGAHARSPEARWCYSIDCRPPMLMPCLGSVGPGRQQWQCLHQRKSGAVVCAQGTGCGRGHGTHQPQVTPAPQSCIVQHVSLLPTVMYCNAGLAVGCTFLYGWSMAASAVRCQLAEWQPNCACCSPLWPDTPSFCRFGIGRFTTEAEIDRAVELTVRHVSKLRDMSPLWELAQEGVDLKSIQWSQH